MVQRTWLLSPGPFAALAVLSSLSPLWAAPVSSSVAPASQATRTPMVEGFGAKNNWGSPYPLQAYEPTVANFQACAQNGDLPQLRRMVALKPELVKLPNGSGVTALHCAVWAPTPDAAKFLLDLGAPVDAVNEEGRTPLYWATMFNVGTARAMVEVLVAHGADVNHRDKLGNNPLHLAVATYNRDSARVLQEHGAHDNTTPLFEALAQNDQARLAALLKEQPGLANDSLGASIANTTRLVLAESLTPLHAAVLWDRPALVQLLLQAKANIGARDFNNDTPLHKAAALNSPAIAALLIDAGADVNTRARREMVFGHGHPYETGFAPLHEAAKAGAVEAAKLLIERGASVDMRAEVVGGWGRRSPVASPEPVLSPIVGKPKSAPATSKPATPPKLASAPKTLGNTALVYAVQAQSAPLVALLLENKANPNGPDDAGAPLLQALDGRQRSSSSSVAASSAFAIARLLLKAGANPNVKTGSGSAGGGSESTPLAKAIAAQNAELVELLLDAGAGVNTATERGSTPLHLALLEAREGTNGRNTIPALLLMHHANVSARDSRGRTPLFEAAAHANVDMVRQLLAAGADPKVVDAQGQTPLLLSLASKGVPSYDEISTLLRARGAGDAASSLFEAIERGDAKAVETAIAASPKLLQARSSLRETPLAHAIRHHQEKIVDLLAHGASLEARSNGSTPLFLAVDFGPPEAVTMLLKRGAQVNACNDSAQTPLFWAVHNGNSEMVSLLLKAGADAKAVDREKRTPLHVCVDEGSLYDARPNLMDILLKAGADPGARDRDGQTPLHLAAQNGKRLGVAWLLTHGAQINVRDNANWTPLHWATNRSHAQTIALLKKHGAKL